MYTGTTYTRAKFSYHGAKEKEKRNQQKLHQGDTYPLDGIILNQYHPTVYKEIVIP